MGKKSLTINSTRVQGRRPFKNVPHFINVFFLTILCWLMKHYYEDERVGWSIGRWWDRPRWRGEICVWESVKGITDVAPRGLTLLCWVSLCLLKSTFLWNALPQRSQEKGLYPECFLVCVIRLLLWLNAFPQTTHLWGFSPKKFVKVKYQSKIFCNKFCCR